MDIPDEAIPDNDEDVPSDEEFLYDAGGEELPPESRILAQRLLDELREDHSERQRRRTVESFLEKISVPIGLPTIQANFAHPELTPREARALREEWMQDHRDTIEVELREGCQPRKINEGPRTAAVAIPLAPNIVTNRFANNLLRNVLAPSGGTPMIAEFGTTGESQYKFMAVNAMGVGTDSAAAAVGDTQLGAAGDGGVDSDQFSWYHISTSVTSSTNDGTFGSSIPSSGVNDDVALATAQGADVSARDTGGTYFSGTRSPSDAAFTLRHNDDSPAAGDFEFEYECTWRFGADGDERDGNFGSDASPVSWRELGLANELMTGDATGIHPAGAHPDSVHHLATRRTYAGGGFSKTSNSELTNQYIVRFSSG